MQKIFVPTPKSFPASARYQAWGCSAQEPGTAREPIAMSYPSVSNFGSSFSTSVIGVLWSASVKSTNWPRASSMPAFTAPPLPRFGLRSISRSMGNSFDNSRATVAVSSRLPSLTTIISKDCPLDCRYLTIPGTKRLSRSCSLYAGMTTDRYGLASITGSGRFSQHAHFTHLRQRFRGIILVQFLPANPLDVIAHAVARGFGWPPAEPLEFGNIRDAVACIANPVLTIDVWLDLYTQCFRDDTRKLDNGVAPAAANIKHLIVCGIVFQGEQVGASDIADVHVIPQLLSVFKNRRALPFHHLQREDAQHTRVGVAERLVRPLHDRVAQRHAGDAVIAAQRDGHQLLRVFCDRVLVLRSRMRLQQRQRFDRPAAFRANRFPQASCQSLRGASIREHLPIFRALVAPLAVDKLAAGDDDLPHRQFLRNDQFVQ